MTIISIVAGQFNRDNGKRIQPDFLRKIYEEMQQKAEENAEMFEQQQQQQQFLRQDYPSDEPIMPPVSFIDSSNFQNFYSDGDDMGNRPPENIRNARHHSKHYQSICPSYNRTIDTATDPRFPKEYEYFPTHFVEYKCKNNLIL
jgi:hypothetical protein